MPGTLQKLPLLPVLLVVATFAPGCAGRTDRHAGVTVEREEIRAGHRLLLKSGLAPRRATLGDPVEWTLSAELPAAAAPGKLLRDPRGTDLDVRPPKEPVHTPAARDAGRSESREIWTWSYRIRAFALGKVPLPAMRLPVAFGSLRDTLVFPADTVAIDSLTPAATGAVLPDRGPITPELRPVDYAVAGVIALVLLAAILLLMRALRRRRAPVAPAAPAEPPDVLLRREVTALRERGEPLPRDEFYDRLSLAIRDYAAAVTGITTRDRTTLEIVRELREREEASSEGVDALRRALARADLAKFARRGGGWDEAMEALDLAERLPEKLAVRTHAPEADAILGNGEPPAPDARAGGTGGR
ncbi:MAG TPA: hypothetical protein VGQ14_04150 [Candidatus Eisenbacteria bacterium]|jgi:hypothetical protein|nr:hypothetical protein [Candidatus Eisenbacteria bacterium]